MYRLMLGKMKLLFIELLLSFTAAYKIRLSAIVRQTPREGLALLWQLRITSKLFYLHSFFLCLYELAHPKTYMGDTDNRYPFHLIPIKKKKKSKGSGCISSFSSFLSVYEHYRVRYWNEWRWRKWGMLMTSTTSLIWFVQCGWLSSQCGKIFLEDLRSRAVPH